jgi:prevent-host-death family protein
MIWQFRKAEARFNDLLDVCLQEGPQVIARNGKEEAVLVSLAEWQRVQPKNIKAVLLAPTPIVDDMMIPKRGQYRHRKPPKF